ncbi:MAG TPA: family 78 glycoside hydrolase catalytic domain [Fimbriimonadaceae bacterium]|nr:family 78 glycoside hydrolase catalytic domain [Fimbriimonadaceae bacterium]
MSDLAAPHFLRTEYLVNPLGLDTPRPRLSYLLRSAVRNVSQTAFQIQAATTLANLESGEADLWDSGKVPGSETNQIEYSGKALEPVQTAFWRARVWDQADRPSDWSEVAVWEAGLPLAPHWTGAQWIGCPSISLTSDEPSAVYLHRSFEVERGIKRARLFVSAKGLYIAELNGQKVGDFELTPGWTDYHRRIPYEAYDVTDRLQAGSNRLLITLGDGWYCGNVCWFGRKQYGPYPEALVKLYVEFEDAEPLRLVSDSAWEASEGPIRANDLLMGEMQDLRMSLEASERRPVVTSGYGQVPAVGRACLPVRAIQTIRPTSVEKLADGSWRVDMGQNMVGRLRLDVSGLGPAEITVRHAEILDVEGNLYIENLRKAKQIDKYILGTDSITSVESKFTFHGFRYVQIEGWPGELTADRIEGVVLSSIDEPAGDFQCGNAMVNQLVKNIRWGQWGNYLEVPTDCPQRDERLGWMGDAQIFAPTAAYNFDTAPFLTKWMQDVRDAQTEDGAFPNVAPQMLQLGDGAPAWADAGVIVPWTIYQFYGDRQILADNYDAMARYVQMVVRANPNLIWRNRSSHNFADWLNVETPTPPEVLATAYLAHSANLLAQTALAHYSPKDIAEWERLAKEVRAAFQREFVDAEGRILGDTQTAYVLALRFNLLSETQAGQAARHLVADLEKKGHLTTGFLGVGHLLPVLTQIGRDDLALKLLLNEEYPSWGYSIRHGATTIWERWDGWTEAKGFQDPGMNSFNHYALGSCGEWIFGRLAGIQPVNHAPGFAEFTLAPLPNRAMGWAKAHYDSIRGRIESSWKVERDRYEWTGTVPPNTLAGVRLPLAAGSDFEWDGPKGVVEGPEFRVMVGSGTYRFVGGLP